MIFRLMQRGPVEDFLSDHGIGAENAKLSPVIMAATNFENVRVFRAQVERERANGALILSNSHGLFLPDRGDKGRAELRQYVRTGTARIKGQARALRPARQALKRLEVEGQTKLEEGGGECGEA